MRFIISRFIISVGVFLITFRVSAQMTEMLFEEISKEYPDESAVCFDRKIEYIFQIENDKPSIYLIDKLKIIYLKNPAGLDPTQSLYTSTMIELVDYEANSYVPEGTKYRKKEVKEYREKTNVDNNAFYDDIKELSFTFHGVGKGTILELNSKHKVIEPRIVPSVYLTMGMPLRNFDIIIERDLRIEYDLIFMNNADQLCQFAEERTRTKEIKSCRLSKLNKIVHEEMEPATSYFEPHFITRIKSYTIDGKETELLHDINALYKWYYSLISDVVEYPVDLSVQALADSLTRNCNTEEEQVKTLYYWVQTDIKYVAFEYGFGGIIPRRAEETLKNRYGDCKDKTILLYSLLKARGITSYVCWIGTNSIPYTYTEVPTPMTDNHQILAYPHDDHFYFLDGTNDYYYYPLPSEFIQGKEALIGISSNEFRVEKVPVQLPEINNLTDSVVLNLKGNSIHGIGKMSFCGYQKTNMYLIMEDKIESAKRKTLERHLMKGNNKFVLEDYTMPVLNTFEPSTEMDYTFTIEDYVKSIGDTYYINLNLDQGWLDYKTKEDRKHPVSLNYATSSDSHFSLQIPENLKVDYIPENTQYKSNHFKLEIIYSYENGVLKYDMSSSANTLYINQNTLPEWNEFLKVMEQAFKQNIILKTNE